MLENIKIKRTEELISSLPGGEQQLNVFAKDLSKVLKCNNFDISFVELSDVILAAIYVRLSIMGMDDRRIAITVALKLKNHGFYLDDKTSLLIVYLFKLHKANQYFSLDNPEDADLFEACKLEDPNLFQLDNLLLHRDLSCLNGTSVCFDNNEEFLLLVVNTNKNVFVNWVKNEEYFKQYKQAYALVEAQIIEPALILLKNCLKYSPVSIASRCEIIECLLRFNKNELALSFLLDMKEYIYSEKDIAWFYRRLGYVFIELEKYDLACACFKYSLRFENAAKALNELRYIEETVNVTLEDEMVEPLLLQHKIPLCVPKSLEDIIVLVKELGIDVHLV